MVIYFGRVIFWERLCTACLLPSALCPLMGYTCWDGKGLNLGSIPSLAGVYTVRPQPVGQGSQLGSPRLREKLRRGWIYASTVIHRHWAIPTPRLIFISSPLLRHHPVLLLWLGALQRVLAIHWGQDLPVTHQGAWGQLTPTWLGRDLGKKAIPSSEALSAKSVLGLTTMCIQLPYSPSFCLSLDSF